MSHLLEVTAILKQAGYLTVDRFNKQFINVEGRRIDYHGVRHGFVTLEFKPDLQPDDAKRVFGLKSPGIRAALERLNDAQSHDNDTYATIHRLVRRAAVQEGMERYETLREATDLEYVLKGECELVGPLVDEIADELGLDEEGLTAEEKEQVKQSYLQMTGSEDMVIFTHEERAAWDMLVAEAKGMRAVAAATKELA